MKSVVGQRSRAVQLEAIAVRVMMVVGEEGDASFPNQL